MWIWNETRRNEDSFTDFECGPNFVLEGVSPDTFAALARPAWIAGLDNERLYVPVPYTSVVVA
jgi:hypothetical protein